MPQMSPMWWTTLFMMFIVSYILYMIIMYFYVTYNLSSGQNIKTSIKPMDWMW